MKFSEEVVLGSTLIKFVSDSYLYEGCGCLIGMAGASKGETCFDRFGPPQSDGFHRMAEVFPWLFINQSLPDIMGLTGWGDRPIDAINASARYLGIGKVTFEQTLAWLRTTIDPIQEEWDRTHTPQQPVTVHETCLI